MLPGGAEPYPMGEWPTRLLGGVGTIQPGEGAHMASGGAAALVEMASAVVVVGTTVPVVSDTTDMVSGVTTGTMHTARVSTGALCLVVDGALDGTMVVDRGAALKDLLAISLRGSSAQPTSLTEEFIVLSVVEEEGAAPASTAASSTAG